jgi:tRNA1Val (adenine37-N6)-methyltransferase
MGNDYFRFKQFMVRQERCAMKVGTDGVLLGAWAGVEGCRRVLDVGTGTGLIALMLAQRNPDAAIEAIDMDESAYSQAKENVEASPFAGRIRVVHASFAAYAAEAGAAYDLVVSNPPYFVRSLKNPDAQRRTARHTDSLPLDELLSKGKDLLTSDGRLALILPAGREGELRHEAVAKGLNVTRLTSVVPVPGAGAKRILAELSASRFHSCPREHLLIEESRHRYSPAYVELTKDFYLNF